MYSFRTRMAKRITHRYLFIKRAQENKCEELFRKIAPTYKSKKSGQEILWITAYKDKTHPNYQEALSDFEKWKEQNTDGGLVNKIFSKKKALGESLSRLAGKVASKSWAGLKAVAKAGKSEVAGMLVETPKLLYKMGTGDYDYSDKDQLKKDLKTIWGSAVYYGGIAACVMSAGAAAPLLTAKSTAVSLGKSVATHAVIGATSSNADFWGFLSFEAAETTAALTGTIEGFQNSVGFASTDLFDGAVGAISSAIKMIANDSSEYSKEDQAMVEFLTKVNKATGQYLKQIPEDELKEIIEDI
jgi:hypothetical protein